MGYRTLRLEVASPLAWVVLYRPRQSNQVNLLMAQELMEVAQRLQKEPGVRALVLTGAGSVFSCGREPVPVSVRRLGGDPVARWMAQRRAADTLAGIDIPVVAALNGDAVDHGLELALACDLRIACRGALLGISDVARGGLPWDGATQRLPRLVGASRALDMLLTSRLVDVDEAKSFGLVNMVVEPEALERTVQAVAGSIAGSAPIANRYVKEAVRSGMDIPLGQGLRLEADLNIQLHSTSDRAEGIHSFLQKRTADYTGE